LNTIRRSPVESKPISELRILRPRHQPQPLEAVARADVGGIEVRVELRQVGQHRQRTVRLLGALVSHRGLFEIGLVDPHLLAVGHDQLLVGLGDLPAEQARRLERQGAAAGTGDVAVRVVHPLLEIALQGMQPAGERVEPGARAGGRERAAGDQRQDEQQDQLPHGRFPGQLHGAHCAGSS
jgi:hypothetical protein